MIDKLGECVNCKHYKIYDKEHNIRTCDIPECKRESLDDTGEQEQNIGSWIEHSKRIDRFYSCSKCGAIMDCMTPYCPWCGAEMELTEEDDDA